MQLLISQFRGVLHKPRIDIIPDPFLPGESGLATQDYVRTHLSSGPNFRQPPPTCTHVRAATMEWIGRNCLCVNMNTDSILRTYIWVTVCKLEY